MELAKVKDKHFLKSDGTTTNFSPYELGCKSPIFLKIGTENVSTYPISQTLIDTLQAFRELNGVPFTVTSGCDYAVDIQRDNASAHVVNVSQNKYCEAVDGYAQGLTIETLFNNAVHTGFKGIGLYISELVQGFRYIHIDTMSNLDKRPLGVIYWVRERKANNTDKNVYKYFDNPLECYKYFVSILKSSEI